MAQQVKKKNRFGWLLWTGFVILLLVVGLGPLALLINYTRDEGLFDFLKARNEQEVEQQPPPVETVFEPYKVQYIYRYCEHSDVFEPGSVPAELAPPPQILAEIAAALHNSNLHIDNLMEYLKGMEGWYLVDMRAGSGQPFFTLTYLGDFCPACAQQRYLGIFQNRIAVYRGRPPHGKLLEVTEYEVRDDVRIKLEEGVPFTTDEEMTAHLEGFTS